MVAGWEGIEGRSEKREGVPHHWLKPFLPLFVPLLTHLWGQNSAGHFLVFTFLDFSAESDTFNHDFLDLSPALTFISILCLSPSFPTFSSQLPFSHTHTGLPRAYHFCLLFCFPLMTSPSPQIPTPMSISMRMLLSSWGLSLSVASETDMPTSVSYRHSKLNLPISKHLALRKSVFLPGQCFSRLICMWVLWGALLSCTFCFSKSGMGAEIPRF